MDAFLHSITHWFWGDPPKTAKELIDEFTLELDIQKRLTESTGLRLDHEIDALRAEIERLKKDPNMTKIRRVARQLAAKSRERQQLDKREIRTEQLRRKMDDMQQYEQQQRGVMGSLKIMRRITRAVPAQRMEHLMQQYSQASMLFQTNMELMDETMEDSDEELEEEVPSEESIYNDIIATLTVNPEPQTTDEAVSSPVDEALEQRLGALSRK